jgi:hypothetical protein
VFAALKQLGINRLALTLMLVLGAAAHAADPLQELRLGRAGHAFDHLGSIGEQADAAAASGATIIYATGIGGVGIVGLPPSAELDQLRQHTLGYTRQAKEHGIKLAIGYICATSIVKLDTFDANWPPELRSQLKTPPSEWLQQDRQGQPLASWYGGDYRPACMNNPDWQAYEAFIVRQQLETGHDGIFFDNPTVHTQGCYCPHCMRRFAAYLKDQGVDASEVNVSDSEDIEDIEAIRKRADARPNDFLRFRSTIARDFLARMRAFARSIDPNALVTCNNSLNSPEALYAQSRSYAYNIHELSKAEDYVVVEDMTTQPRTEADGRIVEYGPTYKQLHAISHGKPMVAVTIAGGDYHTPPNLMRLAMAEAAAHGASYLSWPTWPEDQRERMIKAVRPQAQLLRDHEALLNEARPRADVTLFLPFQRWTETDRCSASVLAAALTKANVQYEVLDEEHLGEVINRRTQPVLLIESRAVLGSATAAIIKEFEERSGRLVVADQPDWLKHVQTDVASPSVTVDGWEGVRAVVQDQPGRSIIHLYNLNVARLSSFDDKVTSAEGVSLAALVPFSKVQSVTVLTADAGGTSGPLDFKHSAHARGTLVEVTIPRLQIAALLVIAAAHQNRP